MEKFDSRVDFVTACGRDSGIGLVLSCCIIEDSFLFIDGQATLGRRRDCWQWGGGVVPRILFLFRASNFSNKHVVKQGKYSKLLIGRVRWCGIRTVRYEENVLL